jgi:hypothetical protein
LLDGRQQHPANDIPTSFFADGVAVDGVAPKGVVVGRLWFLDGCLACTTGLKMITPLQPDAWARYQSDVMQAPSHPDLRLDGRGSVHGNMFPT